MAEPITLPRGVRDYLDGLTAEQVERVLSEPIERWGFSKAGDPHPEELYGPDERLDLQDHAEGIGKWQSRPSIAGWYDLTCKALGLSVVVTAIKDYLRARHVN